MSLILVAIGAAVLLGWMLDVNALKSVVPGLTTMKVNTACGLLLAGVGAWTLGSLRPAVRAVGAVAVVAVCVVAVLTLAEYLAHVDLGIDEFLVADPATTSAPFNGRMSPATAIGFIGASIGLLLVGYGTIRWVVTAGHAMAAVPGLIGLLSLTGYAYNVQALYNFGPFVTVALHTGVGLVVLAAAILLLRPDEGWFRPFVGRPIAKAALARIAVLGLALPFILGLLVVRGIRAGYYEAQVTPALFAVAAAGLLIWLALRSTSILAKAEGELAAARAETQERAEALALSTSRHRALAENLPQLVWTCLPDGRCDYFSPQWTAYTGLAADDQLGFDWLTRVIHPDDADRTLEHWMGAVDGRHPYDIEYRIRGADGTFRWFKTRGTPIRNASGDIEYWFGTSTDIEDIVQAREFLARSRAELEVQVEARTAELMAVEAQLRQSQKMEAIGQLTGGVAHDFNNLLTIIRSASDLLRRPDLREERRRSYVDAISDTADRAAKLTGQLLAFSRRQALKPELFDLRDKLAGLVDMLGSIVGSRILIELQSGPNAISLEVDANQFETAMINLAVNARDAMDGEGTIMIGVEPVAQIPPLRGHPAVAGRFIAVSMSDTGVGIADGDVERIFEPFFTTKAVGKGTGLGLSQVFGFAKQSGGDVAVARSAHGGAVFTLFLAAATAADVPLEAERTRATSVAPSGDARRVLVVEDNEEVGRFSTQLLEDLGYRTTWAHDGAEALAFVDAGEPFDVVFSDVVMPGMNGVELGNLIRSRRPEMPIVLTSGYSDVIADEGQHGFELLKKPYAVEALSRILRRALK